MSFENRSRSSARSMRVGLGAEDRHAGLLDGIGEVERGLAAELHDDAVERAVLLFGLEDLDDVLFGQRLEIEPVGGVVVGRDGLGVAVDHDGLVAGVAAARRRRGSSSSRTRCPGRCGWDRRRGSRPSCGRMGRASSASGAGERGLVGRVHVGGGRGELGGAGVDALVDRADAEAAGAASRTSVAFWPVSSARRRVGKAHGLEAAQAFGGRAAGRTRGPSFRCRRCPGSARGTSGRSCRRRRCRRALKPSRMASATCSRRSGVAVEMAAPMAFSLSYSSPPAT